MDIVTKDQWQEYRLEIIRRIEARLNLFERLTKYSKSSLRTRHVLELLECSPGKLQYLRTTGRIRTMKLGGTIYYNKKDVFRLWRSKGNAEGML